MKPKDDEPVSYVIGPQGTILTPADLPSTNMKRWTVCRKAEIIAAIRGGLLSLEDARERYALTVEELISWQSPVRRDGAPAGDSDGPHSGERRRPDKKAALLFHEAKRQVNKQRS